MATAASPAPGRTERPGPGRAARHAAALALVPVLLLSFTACAAPRPAGEPVPPDAAVERLEAQDSGAAEGGERISADPSEPPTDSEPLIESKSDEHSEVGSLVAGFPVELLPIPADAVILVTSAVPVGESDVQEISLNLTTSLPTAELLELYRGALAAAGFEEVAAEAAGADLAVETMFTRSGGDELISIGVLDANGTRTVTLGGRVHTPR